MRISNKEKIRALREGNVTPEQRGSYWTKEDKRQLTILYCEGVGISEMALEFNRSERAVYQQLERMNLITGGLPRTPYRKKTVCLCDECGLKNTQNCRRCGGAENVGAM